MRYLLLLLLFASCSSSEPKVNKITRVQYVDNKTIVHFSKLDYEGNQISFSAPEGHPIDECDSNIIDRKLTFNAKYTFIDKNTEFWFSYNPLCD